MKIPTLKKCPGCGGDVDAQRKKNGQYQLTCFKFGCITVVGATLKDASEIWNAKRFAEATR